MPQGLFYPDVDGDGYGAKGGEVTSCAAPVGYAEYANDCDDGNSAVHPAPNDGCIQGVDHDCDRGVDEEVPWRFLDSDGDGYGGDRVRICGDVPPPGYSAVDGDCDDGYADAYPGADERCGDARDNDCDGAADENALPYCPDADADGAYACDAPELLCVPGPGFAPVADVRPHLYDCDDRDPSRFPGAEDPCSDGLDSDCDGFDCSPLPVAIQSIATAVLKLDRSEATQTLCHGDLTGDGADDLALGMANMDNGRYPDAGRVSILPGPLLGEMVESDAPLSLSPDLPYAYFGFTLGIGDSDGDGSADLVSPFDILTPREAGGRLDEPPDGPGSQEVPEYPHLDPDVAGSAALFSGPLQSDWQLESAIATLTREPPKEAFAGRLDLSGDLNHDGFDDLVVSVLDDAGIAPRTGSVSIYFGPVEGTLDAGRDADVRILSESPEGLFGWRLHAHGDVNGDGLDDLLVSAPEESSRQCASGAVYVFYGPILTPLTTSDADAVIRGGDERLLRFGNHFSVGDVDGDGVDDLLAGTAPTVGACIQQRVLSYVALYQGPLAGNVEIKDAQTVIDALDVSVPIGGRVSAGSDLDGDGRDDLIITSMLEPHGSETLGAAYVLYGPPPAGRYDVNRADIKFMTYLDGVRFWEAPSGCDLTGDGVDDFVLESGSSGSDKGAVYVVPGGLPRMGR